MSPFRAPAGACRGGGVVEIAAAVRGSQRAPQKEDEKVVISSSRFVRKTMALIHSTHASSYIFGRDATRSISAPVLVSLLRARRVLLGCEAGIWCCICC